MLELERGADPIAGRLYAHQRRKHRFHGWLEFAAVLEAARTGGGRLALDRSRRRAL